jgi:hypothetical protein
MGNQCRGFARRRGHRPVLPAGVADPLECRAQQRITRAYTARLARLASLILQVAGEIEVGQHGGPQGEAEKRTISAVEVMPIAVVGKQLQLAVQRLR